MKLKLEGEVVEVGNPSPEVTRNLHQRNFRNSEVVKAWTIGFLKAEAKGMVIGPEFSKQQHRRDQ